MCMWVRLGVCVVSLLSLWCLSLSLSIYGHTKLKCYSTYSSLLPVMIVIFVLIVSLSFFALLVAVWPCNCKTYVILPALLSYTSTP